jgi:hypothetical protein
MNVNVSAAPVYKIKTEAPPLFDVQVLAPRSYKIGVTQTILQGPKGDQGTGSGAAADFVSNERPAGVIDGSNATFTSAFDFVPESVRLLVNGLGRAPVDEFVTSGNRTIQLTFSPASGDNILIHYAKL